MVHLLLEIPQAPDPSTLETFFGRIPMVFNVFIVSRHGYFGQANVVGLPNTSGQVCVSLYIFVAVCANFAGYCSYVVKLFGKKIIFFCVVDCLYS